jgi:hypothetical protein
VPIYVSAASRLHALLTALMNGDNSQSLRNGWSNLLGVPVPQVQYARLGLPLVASLVWEAAEEAKRAETQFGLPLRDHFFNEWEKPIYAPGGNLENQIGHQQVAPEALDYLASVAGVLRRMENHDALPEGDDLAELLERLDDLADSVETSKELPHEVKQALLRRINELRFAIEHVRVGGPEGVQEAVERLVGAVAVRHSVIPNWMGAKVAACLIVLYAVFSHGPEIQQSIEAWQEMPRTVAAAVGLAEDPDEPEQPERQPAPSEGEPSAEPGADRTSP